MKRWTNGLPGATKRLGAKMALRGLAASQPRMCADTHDGPEQIAPLQRPDTLMQLSRSLISEVHLVPHGRAIHFGTKRTYQHAHYLSAFGGKADIRSRRRDLLLTQSRHGAGPGAHLMSVLVDTRDYSRACLFNQSECWRMQRPGVPSRPLHERTW